MNGRWGEGSWEKGRAGRCGVMRCVCGGEDRFRAGWVRARRRTGMGGWGSAKAGSKAAADAGRVGQGKPAAKQRDSKWRCSCNYNCNAVADVRDPCRSRLHSDLSNAAGEKSGGSWVGDLANRGVGRREGGKLLVMWSSQHPRHAHAASPASRLACSCTDARECQSLPGAPAMPALPCPAPLAPSPTLFLPKLYRPCLSPRLLPIALL